MILTHYLSTTTVNKEGQYCIVAESDYQVSWLYGARINLQQIFLASKLHMLCDTGHSLTNSTASELPFILEEINGKDMNSL